MYIKHFAKEKPESFQAVVGTNPDEALPEDPRRGRGKRDGRPMRDDKGHIIPALEKSDNRWVPRKPTDEDQKVYKSVKGLLNKLTVENFERLIPQFLALDISTADVLLGVVQLIHEKSMSEPAFCEVYAKLCYQLAQKMPELPDSDGGVQSFRKLLLNTCQSEFSRDPNAHVEGLEDLSVDDRERTEKKRRLRSLGNIEFVGELYKLGMLDSKIMHRCVIDLLKVGDTASDSQESNHMIVVEERVSCLCKLLTTVGQRLEAENDKSRKNVEQYFIQMASMSENKLYSSRIRFMLMDCCDLRSGNWEGRRKELKPTTLDAIAQAAGYDKQAPKPQKNPRSPDKGGRGERGGRGGRGGRSPAERGGRGGRDGRHARNVEEAWETVGSKPKPVRRGPGGRPVRDEAKSPGVSTPTNQRGGGGGAATVQRNAFAMLGEEEEDEDEEEEEEGEEEDDEDEAPVLEELTAEQKRRIRSTLDEYFANPDLAEVRPLPFPPVPASSPPSLLS